MPWISNKFLLSLCYVNIMLLGHTRVINKYVNIKCSLFLEIRDLTAFCFYSKNFKCVYPLHNNKYNQPIKLWCAICRLYKARAMYKFSEGFVSKFWFAEKGRNLTSLSQGKDAGFFLLKHFIWFLIYFLNCFILCIFNETIFTVNSTM